MKKYFSSNPKHRKFRIKYRSLIASLLVFVMVVTGIPFIPGLSVKEAYAKTEGVNVSPKKIQAVYHEPTQIKWIFSEPDVDPVTGEVLQKSHDTDVSVCEGGSRSLASGSYATLVEHTVEWDGQLEDGFAKDGNYSICITPTEFSEYSAKGIVEVENPNPPAPNHMEILPNGDKMKKTHKIRGLAEVGTEITLYYWVTYRDGIAQVADSKNIQVLQPLGGSSIITNAARTWSKDIPIAADYFNSFPSSSKKQPGDFVGEWEAEISLKEYEIYHITAVATRIRDQKSSGNSEMLTMLRYEAPDWDETWESLAGYYYVDKTVEAMDEDGKKIASFNGITFTSCWEQPGGCMEIIQEGWQLLIPNAKWAGFVQGDEQSYLRDKEKISNPLLYPRPIGLDPINLATGDFFFHHTNMSLQARLPLSFNIMYHSRDSYNGAIGFGWRHSYEWRLEHREEGKLVVTTSEGASYEYTPQSDGTYLAPQGTYNQLTKQMDGTYLLLLPNKWSYHFRQDGVLVSMTDPNDNQAVLRYTGTILEEVSTQGAKMTFTYGEAGKIAKITDHTGREVQYTYDPFTHDLKSVALPDGAVIAFQYDNKHRMTQITNPNKTSTLTNTYDEEGRVIEQTDFNGAKGTISYNREEKTTTLTDALGRVKRYEYDDRYRQTAVHYLDGTVERYEYDQQDNMTARTDRNGNKWQYIFDGQGNLLQAIDPLNAVTTFRYNEFNKPVEISDPLGGKTLFGYDDRGNVTSVTNALGETSLIERDSYGIPSGMTDAAGKYVSLENDDSGFVRLIKDPAGGITELLRDSLHRVKQSKDALGHITEVEYDPRDRISARIDALGQVERFSYDADSNLISHTDVSGAATSYTYEFDRVKTVTDALGRTSILDYDSLGHLTSVTTPDGGVTTYQYNHVDRLEKVTDPEGNVTLFEYDGNGNLTKRTDSNGAVTQIQYDPRNLPVQIHAADGSVTAYEYDKLGRMNRETDALGNSKVYSYDELGRVIQVTDVLGHSSKLAYDVAGRLIRMEMPNGANWQMKYDDLGLLIETVDPLGNSSKLERDALGRAIASVDETGAQTSYTYDVLGRITTIVNALGEETKLAYDPLGNVIAVTDAKNQITSYQYDAIGRLIAVTDALNRQTLYEYNKAGKLAAKTDALGRISGYEYDRNGRLVKSVNPLGETRGWVYDNVGNVIQALHPDDTQTAYDYDLVNRLTGITYADDSSVQYGYDALGRRTSMTDSTGTTRYMYDALSRLTEVTNGQGKTIRYEWTPTGQRSKVSYPDGTDVNYAYDLMGRLTGVTDGSGLTTTYGYDERGMLVSKQLPTLAASSYKFDALGQMLEMRHENQHGTVVEQLNYEYDPLGNRIKLERTEDGGDEDGEERESVVTEYAYDALNQLEQVKTYNADAPDAFSLTGYEYDAVGNRIQKSTLWGELSSLESYTYDAADKLLEWGDGADYKEYSYDLHGNLLNVTGFTDADSSYDTDTSDVNAEASSEQPLPEQETVLEQYVWDSANRLIRQINEVGNITRYAYDGDGNRISMIVDIANGPKNGRGNGNDKDNGKGNGNGNANGNANGNGNDNGNGNGNANCHEVPPGSIPPGLAKKCGQVEEPYPDMHPGGPREGWEKQYKKTHWEFHYTNDVSLALPEPLMVTEADETKWQETYVYGAGGERVSMTYLPANDPDNGWEPEPGAGGAEPGVAPRTLFYLNDALGSAIGLIEKDGRVSSRYHYDEFGIPLGAKKFDPNWPGPDNLYGYTGLGYDFNSGLTYARARYYKPELGRFISEDTYKGTLGNPQSQNGYTYVQNNPLIYTDPSGHITVQLGAGFAKMLIDTSFLAFTDTLKGEFSSLGEYLGTAIGGFVDGALKARGCKILCVNSQTYYNRVTRKGWENTWDYGLRNSCGNLSRRISS